MGYTGQAAEAMDAMEERTLRDVERWKDKIEVRLDNRQVFLLFFGSALVACLLFILGVVVGKRLESRGRAEAPEIEDPLALLDRVGRSAEGETAGIGDGLTFPRTLMPPARTAKGRGAEGAQVAQAVPAAEKAAAEKAAAEKALAEKALAEKAAAERAAAAEKAAAERAAAAEKAAAEKAAAEKAAAEKAAAARPAAPAAAAEGEGFTLQIGSFQEREEAEEFAAKFSGESPYVVESNIPGKGRWFRVRVGSFQSNAEAMAAKAAFERKHRMIAYVAPR